MSRRSSSSNNLSRRESLATSPLAASSNPKLPPPVSLGPPTSRKSSTLNLDVDIVAGSMLGSRRQSSILNFGNASDLLSSRKGSSVSNMSHVAAQHNIPSIIRNASSVESLQADPDENTKQKSKITFKEGKKNVKKEVRRLENPAARKRKGHRKKRKAKSKSASPSPARGTKLILTKHLEPDRKTAKKDVSSVAKSKLTKDHEEALKKLKDLTLINEKLKNNEVELSKANKEIKSDENLKNLEVEKLIQFWTITRQKLVGEQERATELEGKLQRMKTAHIEQVSLLHKRISMLQLNVQVQRVSSTQTDPFGTDSDCSGFASVDCQTIREWTPDKAHDAIRSNDDQLAELISEIENARLQSQTDFKFAVVQMEQKLRQEHEIELRTIKEEKERQLEDINQVQNDKLLLAEREKAQVKADLTNEITEQKIELLQLRDQLAEKEAQNQSMATGLAMHEESVKFLSSENETLKGECKQLKLDLKNDKLNLKMLVLLKDRLKKIEEINEILLAEFKKIELEKNYLAEQFNQLTNSKIIGHQSKRLQPSFKAHQFGQQLDEIRQNFGGLHIT